jgi:hypothetical protein
MMVKTGSLAECAEHTEKSWNETLALSAGSSERSERARVNVFPVCKLGITLAGGAQMRYRFDP